jgi:hypothetical protein
VRGEPSRCPSCFLYLAMCAPAYARLVAAQGSVYLQTAISSDRLSFVPCLCHLSAVLLVSRGRRCSTLFLPRCALFRALCHFAATVAIKTDLLT